MGLVSLRKGSRRAPWPRHPREDSVRTGPAVHSGGAGEHAGPQQGSLVTLPDMLEHI